jgi:DNA end-binding protein Ku
MASTVWRGFVTFGLVSIPVRLFRAARAERISLRRLYRAEATDVNATSRELEKEDEDVAAIASDNEASRAGRFDLPSPGPLLAPVQQASTRKGSDEVLEAQSLVKGYEYEKGRYVAIDPEDLKSIAPKTATEMQIEEFVNLAEVDPVYFETSYYVAPEEAGKRAYALLYRSLKLSGLVAVAQFAMHSREHVVIVRPGNKGLIAHTMFFSSEVRAEQEYAAETDSVNQKELNLAQTLIASLAATFEPGKYRDSYREKLEAIIAQKVAGQPVEKAEKPARGKAVIDIAEALQKSLAALKKPVASAEQPRRSPKNGAQGRKRAG